MCCEYVSGCCQKRREDLNEQALKMNQLMKNDKKMRAKQGFVPVTKKQKKAE